jgi:hypothetical protein
MKRYEKMNASIRLLVFILLTVMFSSCLSTLYPIFHEKDLAFQDTLLGLWKATDKNGNISYMEFTKIPEGRKAELSENTRKIADKAYLATKMNELREITNQYFVFLVTIDHKKYLDYYPAELTSQKEADALYRAHFIKMH